MGGRARVRSIRRQKQAKILCFDRVPLPVGLGPPRRPPEAVRRNGHNSAEKTYGGL